MTRVGSRPLHVTGGRGCGQNIPLSSTVTLLDNVYSKGTHIDLPHHITFKLTFVNEPPDVPASSATIRHIVYFILQNAAANCKVPTATLNRPTKQALLYSY